jgi:hypothetical protein
MKTIVAAVTEIYRFAERDFLSWPFRFVVEVLAWAISIGLAIFMAITLPNSPWVPMYMLWITGHIMYLWAAWTRGSFGMLANYLLLTAIDSVALLRILNN